MFLDEAIITVRGGDGGDGCVAWHREKYVDRGGPDGGDAGNGGNIIIQANPNTDTLSEYVSRKKFQAENGGMGLGKTCGGKNGNDTVLFVPPGTVITEICEDGSTRFLSDLSEPNASIIVAHGGRGGYGNAHFQSSTRQAPDFAELGEPGEIKQVKLELKLVADVGIIGYPSVGKSSLIAAVSRARPKIAEYHFTTLVPNLGVVHVYDREFILCDVPGLIEGASEGKGLGHAFLKHIERCGIIIHVLDITRDDLLQDYYTIRRELEAYSPTLAKKPEYVILNKIDVVHDDVSLWINLLEKEGISIFGTISAATHTNTDALMQKLLPVVLQEKAKRREEITENLQTDLSTLPILRPDLESEKMGAFRIEKDGDTILVRGKRIEQFTIMTDFNKVGGRQRFENVIERVGLLRALEPLRTAETEVWIGKKKVTEYLP